MRRELSPRLAILIIAIPHPMLEYNKNYKISSSFGSNPNIRSLMLSLKSINYLTLITLKNKGQSSERALSEIRSITNLQIIQQFLYGNHQPSLTQSQ